MNCSKSKLLKPYRVVQSSYWTHATLPFISFPYPIDMDTSVTEQLSRESPGEAILNECRGSLIRVQRNKYFFSLPDHLSCAHGCRRPLCNRLPKSSSGLYRWLSSYNQQLNRPRRTGAFTIPALGIEFPGRRNIISPNTAELSFSFFKALSI